jgi:hypothetical protein
MRSQSETSDAERRAQKQFKSKKKVDPKIETNAAARQAEMEKTARLRALRMTKEAADRETANRDVAAAKAARSASRRPAREPQPSNASERK